MGAPRAAQARGAETSGDQAATSAPIVADRADCGPLRRLLLETAEAERVSMKELTVMGEATDPFRLDTPANHALGRWLAETAHSLGLGARKIHNRGLHYMILGQSKPDGSQYVSDDDSWSLLERASKVARWLGYLPYDQITDQRNAPPVVRVFEQPHPTPYLTVGLDIDLPEADDVLPHLGVAEFAGVQPYKLVMVGEKSSLDVELSPIADRYQADLYLPTGDISDTMVYQIAKTAATDGRPLVVLYFADCDPSGWNMGVVIARKLQAFKALHFPDIEFQVHRAGLTVDQVREFGLPSTPLKASERRGDKWRAAMGVEQTEIDALATLRPELLQQIAREAVAPFWDDTLAARVYEAREAWLAAALRVVNDNLDGERLGRIHRQAETLLAEMRERIDELVQDEAFRLDVDDFDLPPIEVPEARHTLGLAPVPLCDSRWSFVEQTRRLRESKRYGGGSDG